MSKKLRLLIQYWGKWSGRRKFKAVKPILDSALPGQIEITGESISGKPGAFEVFLMEPLIETPLHSKLQGDGELVDYKLDDLVERLRSISTE